MSEKEFVNQNTNEMDDIINDLISEFKKENFLKKEDFYSLINVHTDKLERASEEIYEKIVIENNIDLDSKIVDSSDYVYITEGLYLNMIRLSILSNKFKDYNEKVKILSKSLGLQDY